ncbi:MAG: M50 family metallopeptidase [Planctomycetaceae bacterium]
MSHREDLITAWHEAGHAFVAVYLGGDVESVTIDPDRDDGPQRFGDTSVRWVTSRYTERQLQTNAVLVALGGPVTEMIHRGDPFHPALVAEWSQDWHLAWQAAGFVAHKQQRMQFLEQTTIDLHLTLSQDNHWAAIGAIVDHLLAHETLEGEMVHDIVSEWCRLTNG